MIEGQDTTQMTIDYEQGELSKEDIITLFAYLIKSGLAWTLQGHYGIASRFFIDAGIISEEGDVIRTDVDYFDEEGYDE